MAAKYECTEKYVPVFGDSLDITERLKEIDPSYFLLYNKLTERFELHSSAQKDDSFCLEFPFTTIDPRMPVYARRYGSDRAAEAFAEMDLENARREKEMAEKRYESILAAVENMRRTKNDF